MTARPGRPRRGLVLGAGGSLGYTWAVCALRRLELETGFDPRSAELLVGTSAGSVIATKLAAGVGTAELLEAEREAARRDRSATPGGPPAASPLPPLPRLRLPLLPLVGAALRGEAPLHAALAGLLPEGRADSSALARSVDPLVPEGAWVDHPGCLVVAVDCETGGRVAFRRGGVGSSREAVRASCAVPGWFAPVTIDGRRYVDGGVISSTSLDLAEREPLDEVIVVSPMTSPLPAKAARPADRLERALRSVMSRALDGEVRRVERAGKRVVRVEPTPPELALMGPNFMDYRRRGLLLDAWVG